MIDIPRASRDDFDAMWPIFEAVVATGDTYVFAPSSSRDDALAYWFGPGVASWVAAADGRIAGMYKLVANQRDLGALALWRTLGFSVVGTLPRAFRHSALGYVDAHVLHRSLDDVDAWPDPAPAARRAPAPPAGGPRPWSSAWR